MATSPKQEGVSARDRLKEEVQAKWRREPLVVTVYLVLRALVILTLVHAAFSGRFEHVAICVLVLLLFMVPSVIEKRLVIEFPDLLEALILVFVFAAEILGEISSFYILIPFWDTILHSTWGFLCAGIGFSLVDILNRSEKVHSYLSPLYMAISAVAFSMAVGALWEIFEYAMDCFVGFDMQKDTLVTSFGTVFLDPTRSNVVVPVNDITSTLVTLADGRQVLIEGGYLDIGIHDSMQDLIVNLVGAVVFAFIGYKYVKDREKGSIAARLIPYVRWPHDGGEEGTERG